MCTPSPSSAIVALAGNDFMQLSVAPLLTLELGFGLLILLSEVENERVLQRDLSHPGHCQAQVPKLG